MSVSPNAVRLAALVVAATAAGYLWRAALEPSARTPTIIRLAPANGPEVPAEPVRQPPVSHRVAPKHARTDVTARHRPVVRSVASRTAAPAPRPSRPAPARPAPKPQPKPTPGPAPKPPTTPSPSPAPPAEAPSQEPVASASPTPAPTPEPAAQPPTEAAEAGKPGWGHGDKNHDHSGPHGGGHG